MGACKGDRQCVRVVRLMNYWFKFTVVFLVLTELLFIVDDLLACNLRSDKSHLLVADEEKTPRRATSEKINRNSLASKPEVKPIKVNCPSI